MSTLVEADFYIRQGDTLPTIKSQLVDENGVRIPLAGASAVNLVLKRQPDANPVLDKPAIIRNTPELGEHVEYVWIAADTANLQGEYQGYWQVYFGGVPSISVPNDGFFTIVVTAREVEMSATLLPRLRRLVADRIPADSDDTDTFWSNADLLALLDEAGDSIYRAAFLAWEEKVSELSKLIDQDRTGTNLKLSQRYRQAKELRDYFAAQAAAGGVNIKATRVVGKTFSLDESESLWGPREDPNQTIYPWGATDVVHIYPLYRMPAILGSDLP